MSWIKAVAKWLLALFFVSAGAMHFVRPAPYVALVPPFLPAPLFLVYASGVAELVFGVLLVVPRFQRVAAWGIIATLVAVFPANLYHAFSGGLVHPDLSPAFANPTIAWARLPFQFLFIAWAWWFTRPERGVEPRAG